MSNAATLRIRNRRNTERRMRAAGEVLLIAGACVGVALFAVGVIAIMVARYNAGL